jgi:hypothetical protein
MQHEALTSYDSDRETYVMTLKKTFVPAVLIAGTALLLAACGQAGSNNSTLSGSSSTQTAAAKPSHSASTPTAKPFNAGGFLGGNVNPSFPDGALGKVAVVAQSILEPDGIGGGTLLIAYRNNTSAAISHVNFDATAAAGGKVVATGQSQAGAIPAQVQPGEVALDYIYFDNVKSVPHAGVTYRFTVQTMPADTSSYNTAPLKITQATNNGSAIIGAAVNNTGKKLTGPYGVHAYCLDGRNLTTMVQDYAHPDGDLAAGSQASFTIDLSDTKCDKFVIGASGYFD